MEHADLLEIFFCYFLFTVCLKIVSPLLGRNYFKISTFSEVGSGKLVFIFPLRPLPIGPSIYIFEYLILVNWLEP